MALGVKKVMEFEAFLVVIVSAGIEEEIDNRGRVDGCKIVVEDSCQANERGGKLAHHPANPVVAICQKAPRIPMDHAVVNVADVRYREWGQDPIMVVNGSARDKIILRV